MSEENKDVQTNEAPAQNKNMKACKVCGAPIAKNAKKCPQCGAKNKKPIYKRAWFIIIVLIALIAIISAITSGSKSYDFDNPDYNVTADTIISEFESDSTAADSKYEDKVVAVTGQVATIEEDYITIRAFDDDLWLYNVTVYMTNAEDIAKFTKGSVTTVVGVCDGSSLFGNATIKQCTIAEKFAITPDYDNPLDVDAKTIVTAYQDNQVSADSEYKYKTIKITGKITNITDDYAVIEPKGTDVWDWDSDIQVYFETEAGLASLKEGSTVTITGDCYGQADFYCLKICRAIVAE